MADIFVSYKKEDRARVSPMAAALEAEGFSVWFDYQIETGGDWFEQILTQLRAAPCVIGFWTSVSVTGNATFAKSANSNLSYVLAEHREAGPKLLPALMDAGAIPAEFSQLQAEDLVGWTEDRSDPRWRRFVERIEGLAVASIPAWVRRRMAAHDASLRAERARRQQAEEQQEALSLQLEIEARNSGGPSAGAKYQQQIRDLKRELAAARATQRGSLFTIGLDLKQQARRRDYNTLALGLIAAEAGEFEEARRLAYLVEGRIEDPRLALLLQARAAEVAGDTEGAERAYSGMLQNDDTEVLGRKGLMAAALKRGDRTAARAHAEFALKASKTASWPFQYAFDLAVQSGDWEGALDALEIGDNRKQIASKVAQRRRSVLMAAQAAKFERERAPDKAVDMAQKAFRIAPSFPPAGALAARLLIAAGKTERAAAILEEAWENSPHPELLRIYSDLIPGESREARAARLRPLADRRRDHRESRILTAELAMERGDWGVAQAALEDAYRESPSSRICILFAQVARGRGDEHATRTWLAQAAASPREADWSDLDPEGPAFLFDDSDWARLVYVFGDGGQLIHPRMERGGTDALGPVIAFPATV